MTDTPPTAPARSRRLKGWLIAASLADLLLVPLAAFWGMMSVMASTTTGDMVWANTYALVNLSLPVAMVVSLVAAWVAWARGRDRLGWILLFSPLAWLVVSIGMMSAWPAR